MTRLIHLNASWLMQPTRAWAYSIVAFSMATHLRDDAAYSGRVHLLCGI